MRRRVRAHGALPRRGSSAHCSSPSLSRGEQAFLPTSCPAVMLPGCFHDPFAPCPPSKNASCSFSPSGFPTVMSSTMFQLFVAARKGAAKHSDPFRRGTTVLLDGRRPTRAAIAPTKELACQTRLLHLHHGALSRPAAFSWEESPSLTARSRQRCHPSLSARGHTGRADRDAPSWLQHEQPGEGRQQPCGHSAVSKGSALGAKPCFHLL